jgi:hypothetical protein
MTLLAAMGDISRFPTAKKRVGYSGLASRVHDSGQYRRTGRMTEAGAKEFSTMHRETQTKKPVEGVVIPSPNFFAKMWPQKELALAAGRRAIAAGGAHGQCVSG